MHQLREFSYTLLALGIGFFIGGVFAFFLGESPLLVFNTLFLNSIQSLEDFGLVLGYVNYLLFAGLAVALPLRVGLFNIGGEGQILFSAFCLALGGAWLTPLVTHKGGYDVASIFLSLLLVLIALGGGFFWSGIVIFLKQRFNAHEVIVSMMLNFIAAGCVAWAVQNYQNPLSQNPEMAPLPSVLTWLSVDPIKQWLPYSFVSSTLIAGVLLILFLDWLFMRSALGERITATGLQPEAAKWAGVRVDKLCFFVFSISGALAAFVSVSEILGHQEKLRLGFSNDIGFTGIAVAILAKGRPLYVLPASFLFAIIMKGSSDLDFESEILTRDFARILQGVLILAVASQYWLKNLGSKKWGGP